MSFLSLDCSQNDSRLNFFLTKGKRVFHVSILSLVLSGNGYASGRLSFGQASTPPPRHTYHVTVLVFVCPYIRTYDISTCFTTMFSDSTTIFSTRMHGPSSWKEGFTRLLPRIFIISSIIIWYYYLNINKIPKKQLYLLKEEFV